jgi:RNA polymerase sigma-70 factor, ECF subfamily
LNLFSLAAFDFVKMPSVDTQEQLPVAEARTGDAEAWNALFARYQMPLYVYVFELIHDEQTSLDVVQETFINATRHIGCLREEAKFGSWLFSIAHQKVVEHWRRRRRNEPLDEEQVAELPSPDDDPRAWIIRQERKEDCLRRLGELSQEHREVLLLYFLEEFSLEEIAVITQVQLGTVKSRMHYAKRKLRKLIEENSP